ncbi:hypothetical protein EVAR_36756_1 [Eumeta japonica]|uniref:Uncharacterized protein n=1 Tax=Eumeta variegata TaxID=151549 RepID=A0A4C1X004_EUMVA|nr:hypothetical protein EVAR_36756_1 [Eumeta japonica]
MKLSACKQRNFPKSRHQSVYSERVSPKEQTNGPIYLAGKMPVFTPTPAERAPVLARTRSLCLAISGKRCGENRLRRTGGCESDRIRPSFSYRVYGVLKRTVRTARAEGIPVHTLICYDNKSTGGRQGASRTEGRKLRPRGMFPAPAGVLGHSLRSLNPPYAINYTRVSAEIDAADGAMIAFPAAPPPAARRPRRPRATLLAIFTRKPRLISQLNRSVQRISVRGRDRRATCWSLPELLEKQWRKKNANPGSGRHGLRERRSEIILFQRNNFKVRRAASAGRRAPAKGRFIYTHFIFTLPAPRNTAPKSRFDGPGCGSASDRVSELNTSGRTGEGRGVNVGGSSSKSFSFISTLLRIISATRFLLED